MPGYNIPMPRRMVSRFSRSTLLGGLMWTHDWRGWDTWGIGLEVRGNKEWGLTVHLGPLDLSLDRDPYPFLRR